MAVDPQDLIAPVGEVEYSFFPDDTQSQVLARIAAYVSEAEANTPGATDPAVMAWAYHRAYKQLYLRMSAAPTSATLNDEGSVTYTQSQAVRFKTLSDEWLGKFTELTSTGTATTRSTVVTHTENYFVF